MGRDAAVHPVSETTRLNSTRALPFVPVHRAESRSEGFEVKVTEAINKRVPIIASDAGGIPLQVQHGKNGWIVPSGQSEPVAQLLLDIHEGHAQVTRPLEKSHELAGHRSDPNAVAESFARDFARPYPKVHADENATSEDFWTVGNATRWMLVAARLIGLEPEHLGKERGGPVPDSTTDGHVQKKEQEMEVLRSMEVGEKLHGKVVDGRNVWKMVMGNDMLPGEAELR